MTSFSGNGTLPSADPSAINRRALRWTQGSERRGASGRDLCKRLSALRGRTAQASPTIDVPADAASRRRVPQLGVGVDEMLQIGDALLHVFEP